MNDFSITSDDFKEGGEIPKKFGYKFENQTPKIIFHNPPENAMTIAIIMDDPDAMKAVGKVWVHWLAYHDMGILGGTTNVQSDEPVEGKTDFGETKYGGPAPPDGKHTYVFKVYALDVVLDLEEGYSKQELEDAMKGHILSEAKLTGTFAS